MGFVKYNPFGSTRYTDLTTTTRPEIQLWQELVMLRHIRRPRGVSAKKASAPWVDQAKTYFHDACTSDWRTAGLLYYYSFLNLAKAYLAAKRVIPARVLKSTSIYHGLSADSQSPSRLVDFAVDIHPPLHRDRRNIFSTLCERLTGDPWPHRGTITLSLGDVLPYCREISAELEAFYGMANATVTAQSLIRDQANTLWFEVNVPNQAVPVIQSHLPMRGMTIVNFNGMNNRDFSNWLVAFDRTKQSLAGTSFIRTTPLTYTPNGREELFRRITQNSAQCYAKYALPFAVPQAEPYQWWLFIPRLSLRGRLVRWHPLLSGYVFAFVISTILRYHPHLLPDDSDAAFTAKAWCNQSAITILRYFLMAFTTPSRRIACC